MRYIGLHMHDNLKGDHEFGYLVRRNNMLQDLAGAMGMLLIGGFLENTELPPVVKAGVQLGAGAFVGSAI